MCNLRSIKIKKPSAIINLLEFFWPCDTFLKEFETYLSAFKKFESTAVMDYVADKI